MKDAFERELGYAQPEIYRNQVRDLLSAYKSGNLEEIEKVQLAEQEDEAIKSSPTHLFPNVDGIKILDTRNWLWWNKSRYRCFVRFVCRNDCQPKCGRRNGFEFRLSEITNRLFEK